MCGLQEIHCYNSVFLIQKFRDDHEDDDDSGWDRHETILNKKKKTKNDTQQIQVRRRDLLYLF